eukprot:TRINITY_DN1044_c2_g1_i3.p1 TRINITY_DN1044_c2_g1~~TRINITY_DN1044_c2_g1_i3.p1  ORF type:complete len:371 (-),score=91.52 TRINITY_DN1044_c2_g1_i3:887-1999(-)
MQAAPAPAPASATPAVAAATSAAAPTVPPTAVPGAAPQYTPEQLAWFSYYYPDPAQWAYYQQQQQLQQQPPPPPGTQGVAQSAPPAPAAGYSHYGTPVPYMYPLMPQPMTAPQPVRPQSKPVPVRTFNAIQQSQAAAAAVAPPPASTDSPAVAAAKAKLTIQAQTRAALSKPPPPPPPPPSPPPPPPETSQAFRTEFPTLAEASGQKKGNAETQNLAPHEWPPALKEFAQRAFASVASERQQEMETVVTALIKAVAAGNKQRLWTHNWAAEPTPTLFSSGSVLSRLGKKGAQTQTHTPTVKSESDKIPLTNQTGKKKERGKKSGRLHSQGVSLNGHKKMSQKRKNREQKDLVHSLLLLLSHIRSTQRERQ